MRFSPSSASPETSIATYVPTVMDTSMDGRPIEVLEVCWNLALDLY